MSTSGLSTELADPTSVAAPLLTPTPTIRTIDSWTYEKAFQRNRGLITAAEQEKLRHSRVAIAGMGGVGGVHLVTLARLGIGRFTLADPDVFEVANFNRQFGATIKNLGRNKAEAMAEAALDINPELDLRVFNEAIDESNVDLFLKDCDLFVDGLDFFAVAARRMVFRRAAELGIWAITAGPIGFSAAWLAFDPNGMTFDEYFDLSDSLPHLDKLAAFAVGLTPKAMQRSYMDLSSVDIQCGSGPSLAIACQLSAGVIGTLALGLLVDKTPILAVPHYQQLDLYHSELRCGRLKRGNKSIRQRLKIHFLKRFFTRRSFAVRTWSNGCEAHPRPNAAEGSR